MRRTTLGLAAAAIVLGAAGCAEQSVGGSTTTRPPPRTRARTCRSWRRPRPAAAGTPPPAPCRRRSRTPSLLNGHSAEVRNVNGAAGTIGLAELVSSHSGDAHQLMVTGLVMVGGVVTNKSPVDLDPDHADRHADRRGGGRRGAGRLAVQDAQGSVGRGQGQPDRRSSGAAARPAAPTRSWSACSPRRPAPTPRRSRSSTSRTPAAARPRPPCSPATSRSAVSGRQRVRRPGQGRDQVRALAVSGAQPEDVGRRHADADDQGRRVRRRADELARRGGAARASATPTGAAVIGLVDKLHASAGVEADAAPTRSGRTSTSPATRPRRTSTRRAPGSRRCSPTSGSASDACPSRTTAPADPPAAEPASRRRARWPGSSPAWCSSWPAWRCSCARCWSATDRGHHAAAARPLAPIVVTGLWVVVAIAYLVTRVAGLAPARVGAARRGGRRPAGGCRSCCSAALVGYAFVLKYTVVGYVLATVIFYVACALLLSTRPIREVIVRDVIVGGRPVG